MLKVVEKQDERETKAELLPLDEFAREGARRMLIDARLRRRPTITSNAIAASVTSRDAH
jgi:hypothetical protein